jgi:hypothetical protein
MYCCGMRDNIAAAMTSPTRLPKRNAGVELVEEQHQWRYSEPVSRLVHLTYRRRPGPSGPGGSRSELRSRPQVRIRRWDMDPTGFEYVSYHAARICS